MKTPSKTRHFNHAFIPRISFRFVADRLVVFLLFLFLADCKKEKDEEEGLPYWNDKYYELDWDVPAGYETLRFIGHVRECNIGYIEARVELSGTTDVAVFDTKGEYSSKDVLQFVPYPPQAVLNRTFDLQLIGTVTSIKNGTTCDLSFSASVEYDVNVETHIGTLKMSGTGLTGFVVTCSGYSYPVSYPFATPLTSRNRALGLRRKGLISMLPFP